MLLLVVKRASDLARRHLKGLLDMHTFTKLAVAGLIALMTTTGVAATTGSAVGTVTAGDHICC